MTKEQKESSIKDEVLIENFQWLHEHPELAYHEFETTEYIKQQLAKANIPILDLALETGVVAQIQGEHKGPTIALRSDIDALPIKEETNLAYTSKKDGVMHACGHDFHTATMLGVARALIRQKNQIHGTIKIIFQPAEEAPGGARKIIETGILEDVECYIAVHTAPAVPVGAIGIRKGAVMAAVDRFEIEIQGRGTHAAHPNEGIDPIVIIAAIVQSVQTIVSRNMSPFESDLVSITHIDSGNTWNVIPDKGFMEGTVRSLNTTDRVRIKERLESLVVGITASYGATATLHWFPGPPAVYNDEHLCELAQSVAIQTRTRYVEAENSLGGEDFSLYLEKKPGIFLRVGTGGEYPNHHPRFTADPEALQPVVNYITELAKTCLIETGKKI